jgi:hypothetical protein
MQSSHIRLGLTILFCAGSAIHGQQTPAPPAQEAKPPAAAAASGQQEAAAASTGPIILEKQSYVRRFSAGITGGYSVLDMMQNNPTDQTVENPYLRTRSGSESKSKKYTFGATLNVALTERFAVNVTGLYKWQGYNLLTEFFVIRNGSEVLFFSQREETRSRYIEAPIMIRRYNISRHEPGWRWFYQIGPSMRYVTGIGSTTVSTAQDGTVTTSTAPSKPTKNFTYGAGGGIGLQFIDDFGIRFIPEVRYTRWFGSTWDRFAAQSNRHQVEVVVSFTF